jgi:hypothetical protein
VQELSQNVKQVSWKNLTNLRTAERGDKYEKTEKYRTENKKEGTRNT